MAYQWKGNKISFPKRYYTWAYVIWNGSYDGFPDTKSMLVNFALGSCDSHSDSHDPSAKIRSIDLVSVKSS